MAAQNAPCCGLRRRMERLLADEVKADVVFLVGEEEARIHANTLVLSMTSEVFDSMFYSDFEREPVVRVPDGNPDAFRVLLRFIYTDVATLTLENVVGVLYLAKKYLVTELIAKSIKFVKRYLSAENVCEFLPLAAVFSELGESCLEVVDQYTTDVLNSSSFLDIDDATLKKILGRDTMEVQEILVYARAVEWAKVKLARANEAHEPADIRRALDDALFLTRFPLMSQKEFAAGPAKDGILTKEECLSLYAWFSLSETPDSGFSTKPRIPPGFKLQQLADRFGLTRTGTCRHENEVNVKADCVKFTEQCAIAGCAKAPGFVGTTYICLVCGEEHCNYLVQGHYCEAHFAKTQHHVYLTDIMGDEQWIWCEMCRTTLFLKH